MTEFQQVEVDSLTVPSTSGTECVINNSDIKFFQYHLDDSPQVVDRLLSHFKIDIKDQYQTSQCQSLADKIRILFETVSKRFLDVESKLQSILDSCLFETWMRFRNGKIPRTVLNRCLPMLEKSLKFESIYSIVCEQGILDDVKIRYISEQSTILDKIRILIRSIQHQGKSAYLQFKDCLVKTDQYSVKTCLEEEEARISENGNNFDVRDKNILVPQEERVREEDEEKMDAGSSLLAWIQAAPHGFINKLLGSGNYTFKTAGKGSIVLTFTAGPDFCAKSLNQAYVEEHVRRLLKTGCHETVTSLSKPVHVTVSVMSPDETGPDEIRFNLEFDAQEDTNTIDCPDQLSWADKKLMIEEMAPKELLKWIADQCLEDTKYLLEVESTFEDMSRKNKMENILNRIATHQNGYDLLRKYCKEHDRYVFDRVFQRSSKPPSHEMHGRVQDYIKGGGLQELYSMWIHLNINFEDQITHIRILNQSLPKLHKDLDFDKVIAAILQVKMLDSVKIRDISDMRTRTRRILKLVRCIKRSGYGSYIRFKECLTMAMQDHLRRFLEDKEEQLCKEKKQKAIHPSVMLVDAENSHKGLKRSSPVEEKEKMSHPESPYASTSNSTEMLDDAKNSSSCKRLKRSSPTEEKEENLQAESPYASTSNSTGIADHCHVLNRCLRKLVEDLDFEFMCVHILGAELLDDTKLDDICDAETNTVRITMLVDNLKQKDKSSYVIFKDCLCSSGQSHLKEFLELEELKLSQETPSK